ncbi:MAG TPA: pyridoxal-dependent decarboxylase, pyridoxal binding domain protein [Thermoanaerobaculia bacterium]|nr:pyridoxal-dependent decarboxylase, pyridoxal binding domain protein [Thermoanaerobaculia bacterium]
MPHVRPLEPSVRPSFLDPSTTGAVTRSGRGMETWSQALDLRDLAERFGSPVYLHHPATLRRNFEAYVRLVGEPGNVRYPVKANPSPLVVEALARWGGGADCASRNEVTRALAAGIPVERISYNTPAPDVRLAAWLLATGGTVVADSAEMLTALRQELTGGPEFPGRLFLRISPGGLPGYRHASDVQRYTAHGAATSQFGVPSEEAGEALRDYPLPVSGLHVHVGTQMDNVETFVAGLDFLHRLADHLREATLHPIATLNLGGGLGIPCFPEQTFPTIDELAAALRPLLRPDLRYEVEPGNSLVGESFALLTRVIATKRVRGRRWAIADVGTDQLVKHTVARWEHQVVDADHRPLPSDGPDALAGPLCFAGDVLLPATRLDTVVAGDPLLVRHAGAYCEAIASRFNGRSGPATLVVGDDGGVRPGQAAEDPFFEPALQGFRPESLAPREAEAAAAEPIAAPRVAALQSEYMHRLAAEDGYTVRAMERTGPHSYRFSVEPRAAVDFVAMPLALRVIGDAAITAVGCELGWERKEAPVWATRLALSCDRSLPAGVPLDCQVVVSELAPSRSPQALCEGHVHFRLGPDGEFRGTAKVVVPRSGGAC